MKHYGYINPVFEHYIITQIVQKVEEDNKMRWKIHRKNLKKSENFTFHSNNEMQCQIIMKTCIIKN